MEKSNKREDLYLEELSSFQDFFINVATNVIRLLENQSYCDDIVRNKIHARIKMLEYNKQPQIMYRNMLRRYEDEKKNHVENKVNWSIEKLKNHYKHGKLFSECLNNVNNENIELIEYFYDPN